MMVLRNCLARTESEFDGNICSVKAISSTVLHICENISRSNAFCTTPSKQCRTEGYFGFCKISLQLSDKKSNNRSPF